MTEHDAKKDEKRHNILHQIKRIAKRSALGSDEEERQEILLALEQELEYLVVLLKGKPGFSRQTINRSWLTTSSEALPAIIWAVKILIEQKAYQRAGSLLERALQICKYAYRDEHPMVATVHAQLADVYKVTGDYKQAEKHALSAFHISMRVSGGDHPDAISYLYKLASLRALCGEREAAEILYRKALANCEQYLEVESVLVLALLAELVHFYEEWASVAEELKSSRERDALLLEAAQHRSRLALRYTVQEQWEQAESLFVEALVVYERIQGDTNIDTMQCMDQLTILYLQQKKFLQAEAMALRGLEVRKQQPVIDQLALAAHLDRLAIVYLAERKYEQAEQMLQQAIGIYQRLSEWFHPLLAQSQNNLAIASIELKKKEQAVQAFEEALAIWEKTLGKEHMQVLDAQKTYQEMRIALQK